MNGAIHRFIVGDVIPALKTLPDESVQCCVTSPPYWALRNYTKGHENEIGMESSPQEYVKKMVKVFREVNRVLRGDGVLFLNLGDKYATGKGSMFNPGGGKNSLETKSGKKEDEIYPLKRENISDLKNWGLKPKDLIGIPWRVAFALQEDGWYLRNDNIWHKANCTPFPAMDRFVNSHEYVFLFAKSQKYYFDWYGVSEPVKITTLQRATRGRGSPTNKYLTADDYGQGKQGIHSSITPHSKEKVPARFGISNPKFGGKKYPEEVGGVYSGNGYELTSRKRKRDVWLFATASTSEKHYAVMPETIPEIAILGGTSEHGGCSTCGAPYNRLIEKTFDKLEPVDPIERQGVKLTPEDSAKVLWIDEFGGEYRLSVKGDKHHKMWADQPVKGGRANHYETKGYTILYYNVPFAEDATIEEWKRSCGADNEGGYKGVAKKEYENHGAQNPSDIKRRVLEGMKQVVTSGWEKTCKCEGEGIIQCTVLDPFVGSGTTSAVAKRLNRSSIGIDLDPKNVPIQKKRMGYTEDQNRLVEDCEWVVL